jgi:hypothetical protein
MLDERLLAHQERLYFMELVSGVFYLLQDIQLYSSLTFVFDVCEVQYEFSRLQEDDRKISPESKTTKGMPSDCNLFL